MNICFVTRGFPPEVGGVPSVVFYTGKELVKRGHNISVVTLNTTKSKSFEVIDGMNVYRANAPFFNPHKNNVITWVIAGILGALTLSYVSFKHKVKIVHAMDLSFGAVTCLLSRPLLLRKKFLLRYCGDLAYEIATRSKIKGFSAEQGIEESWKLNSASIKLALKIQKLYFKIFHLILPTTKHGKSLLIKQKVNEKKIFKTHYGVDAEKFKPTTKKQKQIKQIVSGGRFEKWKKFDDIINAMSILQKKGIDTEFSLAGDGAEEKNLKKLAKKLGLEKKVHFEGNVSHEKLSKMMSDSDVFVSASAPNLGISNIVLEAMASGKAVISSDIPGAFEAIKNNENGIIYKTGDVKELSAALEKILTKDDFRKKLEQNARKTITEKFTYAKVADDFLEAYKIASKA
ncbi:MAG: glycosyltransferase family 4 protein [Candidatus Diapherotrites archaeon]